MKRIERGRAEVYELWYCRTGTMAKTTICDTVAKTKIKIMKSIVFLKIWTTMRFAQVLELAHAPFVILLSMRNCNPTFRLGFGASTRTVCDTVVRAQLQPSVSLRFWILDTHTLWYCCTITRPKTTICETVDRFDHLPGAPALKHCKNWAFWK